MVLIVQEYGANILKKSNCLFIKTPSGEKEICIDKVKEVHLYPSSTISADAIQLCMKKDIWIVFYDSYGNPDSEIVPFSSGCSPLYKRNQLVLAHCREGVELAKGFLVKKIKNRIKQLKRILLSQKNEDDIQYLTGRIKRMEAAAEKLQIIKGDDMDKFRDSMQGIEGSAGRAYFEAVSYLMPDEMKFSQRMRNAKDVYNSVLNYLYGILYSKIKRMMIQCRLDPYIGIMHVDTYNKPTFVFDFIEGQRILCEELAYEICIQKKISSDDIKTEKNGSHYFIEKSRKLLISEFYQKLEETVSDKKKKVSREKKIYSELLEVAQQIGEIKYNGLIAI